MAALGSIGLGSDSQFAKQPTDTYMAQDISTNTVGGQHVIEPFFAVNAEDYKSVRGTLLDQSDAAIARTLLLIRLGSKEVVDDTVSDAVTGEFELLTPDASECVVLALPEPGDNRNAVALYNIVPVDQL